MPWVLTIVSPDPVIRNETIGLWEAELVNCSMTPEAVVGTPGAVNGLKVPFVTPDTFICVGVVK